MRSSWTLRPSEGDESEREVRRVGMHFAEVVNLASKGRVCGSYQPCVEGQGCVQPSWQREMELCVSEIRMLRPRSSGRGNRGKEEEVFFGKYR